jgi:uncharacterized membrane protein
MYLGFMDWLEFMVRWLHVIAGIAWIGSSFYFIALDLSLRKSSSLPNKASGQAWQVHGGGFYNMVKYLVAPDHLPDHLTWFKWEAYATWISGAALFVLIYYLGAELYLIDYEKIEMSPTSAILISIFGIIFGWVSYDLFCRFQINRSNLILSIYLLVFFTAMAWASYQILSPRGAFMQIGVTLGTIMVANVLLIIIPGQKKVVAQLIAKETPNPNFGIKAKQRSLHNNYLTLPVIFIMIGNHYPTAYATSYSWLIIGIVIVIGTLIRHFFNERHAGKRSPFWVAIPVVFLAGGAFILSELDKPVLDTISPKKISLIEKSFPIELRESVMEITSYKCSTCHAREPSWEGMKNPPKGVYFDEFKDLVGIYKQIYKQVAASHAMPPGNITFLENEERLEYAKFFHTIENILEKKN